MNHENTNLRINKVFKAAVDKGLTPMNPPNPPPTNILELRLKDCIYRIRTNDFNSFSIADKFLFRAVKNYLFTISDTPKC